MIHFMQTDYAVSPVQYSAPNGHYCHFDALEKGVWKFTFLKATQAAVDEWFAIQDHLKHHYPKPEPYVRMLLNFKPDGPAPLLYTLQSARAWRQKYPDLKHTHIRAVCLLKPMGALQAGYAYLIKEGIMTFNMHQIEVEILDDEVRALTWLTDS